MPNKQWIYWLNLDNWQHFKTFQSTVETENKFIYLLILDTGIKRTFILRIRRKKAVKISGAHWPGVVAPASIPVMDK